MCVEALLGQVCCKIGGADGPMGVWSKRNILEVGLGIYYHRLSMILLISLCAAPSNIKSLNSAYQQAAHVVL